ncbi:DUF2461 domain-containing protein [Sanyastnella coralliicola]|uniref:DUF2461 domain-containing protein n=1 Tax=Sanyastnella coralliicola TaxID=3069118 RepID=UPI0027B8A01C|nr:DUF2461 domain-containing protein [Longitalea sp. SCSIO 12813]
MSYFSIAYIDFFKDLAANNNRDWFHENKKRYEADVKKPFENFIQAVVDRMKDEGYETEIAPKDAIFRINRDIRFSKDKSPYKLNRSAICSKYGRKDKSYPGLYLDFGPEKVWIGGGAYFLDKDMLYDVRDHISRNPKKARKVLDNAEFKSHYGEVRGEKNKIIPKEFKPMLEEVPEIANKQFYYMSEHRPDIILTDQILDVVIDHWKASREMEQFLIEGMVR